MLSNDKRNFLRHYFRRGLYLAKIHYEYGENPSRNHINKNRTNGVGFMSNADKFQLVYVEGSRSMVKEEKEVTDIKN